MARVARQPAETDTTVTTAVVASSNKYHHPTWPRIGGFPPLPGILCIPGQPQSMLFLTFLRPFLALPLRILFQSGSPLLHGLRAVFAAAAAAGSHDGGDGSGAGRHRRHRQSGGRDRDLLLGIARGRVPGEIDGLKQNNGIIVETIYRDGSSRLSKFWLRR